MGSTESIPVAQYKLSFENRTDYLYARVENADSNVETVTAYWKEIAQQRELRGARKILFEKLHSSELSVTSTFAVAATLAVLGFAGTKIAYLKHDRDVNRTNHFAETVSANRGVKVKYSPA